MKVFKPVYDLFAGVIIGISGLYEGAIFRIEKDETITFGRDPKTCQIVADENCSLISRTHCTVKGDMYSKTYTVTDYSSNGTFIGDRRLPKGVAIEVPRGTVISLGDNTNRFKLN